MGRDGGRDIIFEGRTQFPNTSKGWQGYGIIQAKYRECPSDRSRDLEWILEEARLELLRYLPPPREGRKRGLASENRDAIRDARRPDYFILATNLALSSVPGSGGKDRLDALLKDLGASVPLKASLSGITIGFRASLTTTGT